MKKCYLLMLLIFTVVYCNSQSLSYEQKYQFYSERLNRYFVYRGMEAGESLPFRRDGNLLKTEDLPNLLGFYIGVLATEYKLKKNSGDNVNAIVEELHNALYALNRLDTYDAGIGNTALDGFMIREDIPEDFLIINPANNHYSALNFTTPNANYPGIVEVTIHNGSTIEDYSYGSNAAAMSMDHRTRLFLGLALVKKFVDESASYGTFQDGETSIQKEAENITDRIITYMKNGGWFIWMPNNYPVNITGVSGFISSLTNCFKPLQFFNPLSEPCTNCPLITNGGVLAPRGCAPIEYCFGVSQAGKAITGKNYEDAITALNYPIWESASEKNLVGIIAGEGIYSETGNLSQTLILAAIGDSWRDGIMPPFQSTQYYMHQVDQRNQDWRFYTLLHCALHDKEPLFDKNDEKLLQWLDRAPDNGPNNNDDYFYDYNMFFMESQINNGGNLNYTFPGLDYMLLYNLYRIIYFPPPACDATADLLVTAGGTIPNIPNYLPNTTVSAKNSIVTIGSVSPLPGQTWRSGDYIDLNPGFETLDGATWEAEIGDCNELFARLGNSDTTKHKGEKTDSPAQKENSQPLPASTTETAKTKTENRQPVTGNQQPEIISITPNPSTDGKFNLYCSFQDVGCMDAEINVINTLGQTILQEPFNRYSFPISIDLSGQPKGAYFIKIINAEKVIVQKIISQ